MRRGRAGGGMADLSRLISPRSLAIVGGGAWCDAVDAALLRVGFAGPVWRVHPRREGAFRSVADLPEVPDAAFVGVNRDAAVAVIAALSRAGCGGAVCFASGFAEAAAEDAAGPALQGALLKAAGAMPVLGPNCYGYVNYLDRAALWPDQDGGRVVDRGVAILTQSSNIALNLTMQTRALPIAFLGTVGNQAQVSMADLGRALLRDRRITALGLHIEGVGDAGALYDLGRAARDRGVPVVAIKSGRSEAARAAAVSHTASLAGSDAGADALLRHCGIARVDDLPGFVEALKIGHLFGNLPDTRVGSLSCSGGEASLVADLAEGRSLRFPALSGRQLKQLRAALGPRVALANPLDYHTYIWRDPVAMARAFAAMAGPEVDLTMIVADFPRPDRCDPSDWDCIVTAVTRARAETGARFAVVSSLPETMPETVADSLVRAGVLPVAGLSDALDAVAAMQARPLAACRPLVPGPAQGQAVSLGEVAAKRLLARHGVPVPRGASVRKPEAGQAAAQIGFPVVVKAIGLDHKTEGGGVRLNLTNEADVRAAAAAMPGETVLVEAMAPPGVELIVGVTRDPAHGLLLTIGAGGVLTELLRDSATLLLPTTSADIAEALGRLRVAPLLAGWRGAPAVDRDRLIAAILALAAAAVELAPQLEEIEVNPLICAPQGAVAADALLILRGAQRDEDQMT